MQAGRLMDKVRHELIEYAFNVVYLMLRNRDRAMSRVDSGKTPAVSGRAPFNRLVALCSAAPRR